MSNIQEEMAWRELCEKCDDELTIKDAFVLGFQAAIAAVKESGAVKTVAVKSSVGYPIHHEPSQDYYQLPEDV